MGTLNLYQTPHQTLNLYLLPKLEFIFHFALCSQSLPAMFSKQCSAFPRQLGEVPPTQILFYLRQTDRPALLLYHSCEKSPIWQMCLKAGAPAHSWTQTQQLPSPQALEEAPGSTGWMARSFTGKQMWVWACPMLSFCISVNSPSCQANGMVLLSTSLCRSWAAVKEVMQDAKGKWE